MVKKLLIYAMVAMLLFCFSACRRGDDSKPGDEPGEEAQVDRQVEEPGIAEPETGEDETDLLEGSEPTVPDEGDGRKVKPPDPYKDSAAVLDEIGEPILPPGYGGELGREEFEPDDPVPEPSSIILMAVGAIFLSLYMRKRRKKEFLKF